MVRECGAVSRGAWIEAEPGEPGSAPIARETANIPELVHDAAG